MATRKRAALLSSDEIRRMLEESDDSDVYDSESEVEDSDAEESDLEIDDDDGGIVSSDI